ncbi:hypothetical protein MHU86_7314 [Fragilaria crotonensis]|nr:hypothetical protein MHU86_7314 [Fragilaria crotonensis]
MKVNAGYYQNWAFDRDVGCNQVSPGGIDVAGNKYTHLIYSFASINSTLQLEPSDGNYNEQEPRFKAFTDLKKTNPNLKTIIAVGGWSFNDPGSGTATRFSDTASTAVRRTNFANSCVAFCRKYNFDGVDIDWEYPGDTSRGGNSKDKQNLVLLVQKMRSVFDAANLGLQLTMAIPINNLDSGYNLTALADSLDFFNVMAYDIHGPWDDPQVVGANTDIFAIFDDIQNILNKGVSSNKLVLGLAAYGHTFKLVDSSCTTAGYCQPSTMVEKQRPRSGSKFSLKPQIAAALSALPPLGYKAPPSLIGGKHTSHDVLALRARNYAKAYKTLSVKDWNSYVVFGIQQFASPSKYLAIRDSESKHACHLRIGRYYRLHLEHKAPVDKFLMSQIVGIEAALHTTFPGYFDMSVVEMDEYLQTLSPDDIKNTDAAIEVDSPNEKPPHTKMILL